MAEHMSVRDAWIIVLEGDPAKSPGGCDGWESALYARACAIVDAVVAHYESKCRRLDVGHAHSEPRMDEAIGRAFQKARALERGEEGK